MIPNSMLFPQNYKQAKMKPNKIEKKNHNNKATQNNPTILKD